MYEARGERGALHIVGFFGLLIVVLLAIAIMNYLARIDRLESEVSALSRRVDLLQDELKLIQLVK